MAAVGPPTYPAPTQQISLTEASAPRCVVEAVGRSNPLEMSSSSESRVLCGRNTGLKVRLPSGVVGAVEHEDSGRRISSSPAMIFGRCGDSHCAHKDGLGLFLANRGSDEPSGQKNQQPQQRIVFLLCKLAAEQEKGHRRQNSTKGTEILHDKDDTLSLDG